MTELHDPETGEVVDLAYLQRCYEELKAMMSPKMPPEIAKAIIQVKGKVKQLGYDAENKAPGANYSFSSIDKFLGVFGPLTAEAGLFILCDETEWHIDYKQGKQGDQVAWLTMTQNLTVFHESGVSWGPLPRNVIVLAQGPQAFGSAMSYILKTFLRMLFMVPTGDRDDADLNAPGEPPGRNDRPAATKPAAKAANGKQAEVPQAVKEEDERTKRLREAYNRILRNYKNAPDLGTIRVIDDLDKDVIAELGKLNEQAGKLIQNARDTRKRELEAQQQYTEKAGDWPGDQEEIAP